MNTKTDTITRRIRAKQRGWVFTPKDFLDIASVTTVNQILFRLTNDGIIRRLDHGIYDFPKISNTLGFLSPSADDLAKAISGHYKIFPSGAAAANYLGLSTQVPAKPTYLTDGPTKTRKIGNRTITLKHAKLPIKDKINSKVNLLLQALYYLGHRNMDYQLIQQCTKLLDDKDMKDLLKTTSFLPAWLIDIVHQIKGIKDGYNSKAA